MIPVPLSAGGPKFEQALRRPRNGQVGVRRLKYLIILCYRETMLRRLWAGLLALLIASASYAQLSRPFPADGKLGELVGQQQPFPLLQINNKVVRLAPGCLIYDSQNRTILHNQLPQHSPVLFVEDRKGEIARLYLLRPDELERLERTLKR